MSNFSGQIKSEVVRIKILRAQPLYWYAKDVGKVVQALKETTTDKHDRTWVSYKQWPRPTGYQPSGHYVTSDVEEVAS